MSLRDIDLQTKIVSGLKIEKTVALENPIMKDKYKKISDHMEELRYEARPEKKQMETISAMKRDYLKEKEDNEHMKVIHNTLRGEVAVQNRVAEKRALWEGWGSPLQASAKDPYADEGKQTLTDQEIAKIIVERMDIEPTGEKVNLKKYMEQIEQANRVHKHALDTKLSCEYGKRIYKTNVLPSVQSLYKKPPELPDESEKQSQLLDNSDDLLTATSSTNSSPKRGKNHKRPKSDKSHNKYQLKQKPRIKTPPPMNPQTDEMVLPAVERMAHKILDEGEETIKRREAESKKVSNEQLASSLALYKLKCDSFQKQIKRLEKEVEFWKDKYEEESKRLHELLVMKDRVQILTKLLDEAKEERKEAKEEALYWQNKQEENERGIEVEGVMVKQREVLINEVKKLRLENTKITAENLAFRNEVDSLRSELAATKRPPSLSIITNPWSSYTNVEDAEFIQLNAGQVMTMIQDIYRMKIPADYHDDCLGKARMSLPQFINDYFLRKFGMKSVSSQNTIGLIKFLRKFGSKHKRFVLFSKLTGITDSKKYTPRMCHAYLRLLNRLASDQPIATLGELTRALNTKTYYYVPTVNVKKAILEVFPKSVPFLAIDRLPLHDSVRTELLEKLRKIEEVERDTTKKMISKTKCELDNILQICMDAWDKQNQINGAILQELFVRFDYDQSQTLSLSELSDLLKHCTSESTQLNEEIVLIMFKEMLDIDKNPLSDTVTKEAFASVCLEHGVIPPFESKLQDEVDNPIDVEPGFFPLHLLT